MDGRNAERNKAPQTAYAYIRGQLRHIRKPCILRRRGRYYGVCTRKSAIYTGTHLHQPNDRNKLFGKGKPLKLFFGVRKITYRVQPQFRFLLRRFGTLLKQITVYFQHYRTQTETPRL